MDRPYICSQIKDLIVFGKAAILPLDIVFRDIQSTSFDHSSVIVCKQELRTTLSSIYNLVIGSLEINKTNMQCQYNKNRCFIDYRVGQKMWLKTKHFKTEESGKLASR